MPELGDVYQKFDEVAEAAQLLETELGNAVLWDRGVENGLIANPNPELAVKIFEAINRHTLGRLIKSLSNKAGAPEALEALLSTALKERNRLFHVFYREHNFRRNSEEGRQVMLDDLVVIHDIIIRAYKAVLLLNGVDIDAIENSDTQIGLPTRHVPI